MRRVFLVLLILFVSLSASESAWGDKPNTLDPVYKLKVDDYPKFSTEMVLKSGKRIRFCCVKAMIHFYFTPYRYPEYGVKSSEEIDKIFVKDYLDGKEVDAKKAWYVFGSRVVGPHGDDLIPFASKSRAELFVKRYGGSRIMPFMKLSAGLVRYLDM
ncbi:MAG: nitrous oxide reductase accessory protein NosL [Hydrogenimonas sp.]|nr:nitrous oxide reductase accessory protein NosL [Hydrogenimonas sp.]